MDQLNAFQYFITNLLLHNVVLVVAAGLLGLVLGRLVFGASKTGLEKLREALKAEELRAAAAERDMAKLQSGHEELLARIEEGGSPASTELELVSLRTDNQDLKRRAKAAENAAREVEQRIGEAIREREQVEKASAVLRKEMRGLRNKMKEVEEHESVAGGLEMALKQTEERLARSQATVAKESRVKASLEKVVADLERKLAEADAERERLQEEIGGMGKEATSTGAGAGDGVTGGHAGPNGASTGDEAPSGGAAAEEAEEADPSVGVEPGGDGGNLMRIKGIGAVLAKKLGDHGVTTIRQVADWSEEDLEEFSKKLRLGNRAERGDWRGQARALCEGD